jgi:hypothetical protein
MTTRHRQPRRFRPLVDNLQDRCLLSVAVAEVANQSTYNITANFRWSPSSSWTQFTEAPGQGELFWTNYSSSYTPQVLYNTTSSASSQTICTLAQGYGQWSGTGTPPASAASVYQFQNTSAGLKIYYTSPPQQTGVTVDHPAAATTYTNVSAPLFGPNGPSYLDVRQGGVGDCWLLSSLAEVAVRDPSDIQNMFSYQGTAVENGTTVGLYTVRFYTSSGAAKYVTVDTELPSGGNYYDNPNGVLWVALAEKAYAQANGAGYVTAGITNSDSYSALNEGQPAWALQAITGRSANEFSTNPTDIAAAWKAGELVVLGSDSTPSSPYIVGSHAYAVVGYNPSSSQPFTVYNPWGTDSTGWAPGPYNGHAVYGQFTAGAGFLSQNFQIEAFGSGAPAASNDHGNSPTGVAQAVPAGSAPIVAIRPRPSASIQRATVLGTPSNELVAMNRPFHRRPPHQTTTRPVTSHS